MKFVLGCQLKTFFLLKGWYPFPYLLNDILWEPSNLSKFFCPFKNIKINFFVLSFFFKSVNFNMKFIVWLLLILFFQLISLKWPSLKTLFWSNIFPHIHSINQRLGLFIFILFKKHEVIYLVRALTFGVFFLNLFFLGHNGNIDYLIFILINIACVTITPYWYHYFLELIFGFLLSFFDFLLQDYTIFHHIPWQSTTKTRTHIRFFVIRKYFTCRRSFTTCSDTTHNGTITPQKSSIIRCVVLLLLISSTPSYHLSDVIFFIHHILPRLIP